jgi:Sec-independent protein translocase protein TatA
VSLLALFSGLGPAEFIALVVLGILLFGKNLPVMARTVGRTIAEFKRHMKEVEDQIRREAMHEEMRRMREDDARRDREREERDRKEREAAAARLAESGRPAAAEGPSNGQGTRPSEAGQRAEGSPPGGASGPSVGGGAEARREAAQGDESVTPGGSPSTERPADAPPAAADPREDSGPRTTGLA